MADGAIMRLRRLSRTYRSDRVKVIALKITTDGVVENRLAAAFEPYLDTGTTGKLVFGEEETAELVLAAANAGFDVFNHAIGARAVRVNLDAMEEVRRAGLTRPRLTVSHAQWVHDEDMPRFAELDVNVESTGAWAAPSGGTRAVLGEERYEKQMRFQSLVDQGGRFANGSDFPASGTGMLGVNPFLHVEILHTRALPVSMGGTGEPLPPAAERMRLSAALRAVTIDAAYIARLEDQVGSIEVGKKADLIVLDRNLFEIAPGAIHETRVLLTMMDGRVRHDVAFGLGDSTLRDVEQVAAGLDFDLCDHGPDRTWRNRDR